MNVIYCTTKLAKLLGVKSRIDRANFTELSISGSWNAHLFYYAGKKCILFMNKKSVYSVTIYNYKKSDILTLKVLFLKALKEQCRWDKISITEQILRRHFSDFTLSTTDNDRSAIGSLNDLVYHAEASLEAGPPAYHSTEDKIIVFNMNQMPSAVLGYNYPAEKFGALLNSV